MYIPTLADMLVAHERIKPHIHRTPVLTSRFINELTGAELFVKCENLQKAGAFKARGASNAVFGLMPIAVKIVACRSEMLTGSLTAMSGRSSAVAPCTWPRFVPPPAAFVAGALFAFHGGRYLNLSHLNKLGTWWIPLALLFTERWLERARARDAAALGAVVAMQLLSSFYLAYAIVLFYAAYLVVALVRSF